MKEAGALVSEMEKILGHPVDPVIADLIPSDNPEEAALWLRGDRSLIQEPEDVCPGMIAAAESLLEAARGGERVAVFCDYDVDGVTGGEVLRGAISRYGQEPLMGYAHAGDGFGLTTDFVQRAWDEGCRTIVTVDCGSKSTEAIDFARDLGMEVIVTDHHDILEGNNADHHINPQLHDPRPSMATGSQIAWHLGAAMMEAAEGEIPEDYYGEPLYLAGLGCVADWGPHALAENRPFLKADTPPESIRWLAESKGEDASTLHLVWKTSATLNMAKRSGEITGEEVARIIRAQTKDEFESAEKVVGDVQRAQWDLRRDLEREVGEVGAEGGVAIFLTDREGASGIAGPLALRLANKTAEPAFVFAPLKEEGGERIYKFSGRVPNGAPKRIIEMGEDPDIAPLLLAQGGHDFVFSGECREEDIPKIQEAMRRWASGAEVVEDPSRKKSKPEAAGELVAGARLPQIQEGAEHLGPFHKVDGHTEPVVSVEGKISDIEKDGYRTLATLHAEDGTTHQVEVAKGTEEKEGRISLRVRGGGQGLLAS